MTSTFRLVLDTHAPSVVWGGASGTTAGELLRIGYVADEPLDTATLILADARRLPLAVLPDHVEVLLPPDAPDGQVSVEVIDDVGNARTYAAVAEISGTGQPPPVYAPQPSPGFPAGGRRRPARRGPEVRTAVVTSTSTISTTSSAHFAAVDERTAAVSTATARAAFQRRLQGLSEVRTAVSSEMAADVTSDSGRRLEREALVRWRDSPDTEALLLLL
jgi:hypothetical protein